MCFAQSLRMDAGERFGGSNQATTHVSCVFIKTEMAHADEMVCLVMEHPKQASLTVPWKFQSFSA